MDDKRRLKRWRLVYYPSVLNEKTGQTMGHLLDITISGMRLLSREQLPVRRNYLVGIAFTTEEGTARRIIVEARSLWSDRDSNPLFFDTGFRFMNTSPAAINNIQQLIEALKSDY